MLDVPSIYRIHSPKRSGACLTVFLMMLCFYISEKSFAQSFQRLDWATVENGNTLSMPYTGGFHNPQFSNMDLDGDGTEDLMIFDRDGDVLIPVLVRTGPDGTEYVFAPEYKNRFPDMINWMMIRDFNGDGIPDIFTGTPSAGLQGITAYRGMETAEGIAFEQLVFPDQSYPSMIYFDFQGNAFPIYVARIDYPGIIDVDEDGDLDILTFQEGDGVYVVYYENQSIELGYGRDSLIFNRADGCWGKFAESPFNDAVVLSDDGNCAQPGFKGGGIYPRHSGSTVLPLDVDLDGALDLIIGDNGSSDLVYLRNGQESEDALMVEKDINYPSADVPASFPSFLTAFHLDSDGDGSRELLVSPNSVSTGWNSSNIWRYRRGGETGGDDFQYIQDHFLLNETVDLTGVSHPSWVDVDGDNRLDLVVGVYGESQNESLDPSLIYYRQSGDQMNPVFELMDDDFLNFSSLYTDPSSVDSKFSFAPVFADMDGDGDEDIICGEYWGSLIYGENTGGPGNPITVDELRLDWMNIDVGQASAPMIFDFNGDGLKDLIVGERNGNAQNGNPCGNINYFQNRGTAEDPLFTSDPHEDPNSPCFGQIITQEAGSFSGYSTPTIIPVQGNEQLLVGANSGKLMRYVFAPEPGDAFELLEEDWGTVRPGARSAASVADVDGDGIFEMIVGNNRGGLELFRTDLKTDGGTVGVQAALHAAGLKVYPNPTRGTFVISCDDADVARRLSIISMEAKVISSLVIPRGQSRIEVRLNGLDAGVYFARILFPDGHQEVKKVIKLP